MNPEDKLKVAHVALQEIASMPSAELLTLARKRALKALAFSDAPCQSTPTSPQLDPSSISETNRYLLTQIVLLSEHITLLFPKLECINSIEPAVNRLEKINRDSMHQRQVPECYPMAWVKLDRYIELSGDTADSVHSRRKAGKWLDGEQCKIVDGRLWINLQAVDEWIEKWDQKSPARAALSFAVGSAANRSE